MELSELLAELDIVDITGDLNRTVKGIAYNSQSVYRDYIFVAIEGLKLDGHKFIDDAISKGSRIILVSKNVQYYPNTTIIKVSDTRAALSRLAAKFYGKPSNKIKLIGVTGTNGKTTTAYYIKSILDKSDIDAGLIGTLGVYMKGKAREDAGEITTHTTPESLELQKIIADMVSEKIDACVMEVSSHAIQLKRVNDCNFDISIFTNLTHEHLDFHLDMENYFSVKRRLFQMTSLYNIINIDDPFGVRLAGEHSFKNPGIITYGIHNKSNVYAEDVRLYKCSSSFTLVTPKGKAKVKLNIPGDYNIYNALASAACGFVLDLNLEYIKAGLESVDYIPGRFEAVPNNMNCNIIIDYAHTPDGFRKLLGTVSKFAKGRIILVFGCVGERDHSKRSIMGKIASAYCDLCILTTDNCRSENPADIIRDIKEGFSSDSNYIEILDRAEAIRYAILNCRENDTILITGKGHEKKQIIGSNIFYFDERMIISKAFKELSLKKSIRNKNESINFWDYNYTCKTD